MSQIYGSMGVDASKKAVKIIESVVQSSFPYAFTNVLKLSDGRCVTLHVDGAGSKPIIAYLICKEFGDYSFFQHLAQDVLAMNLDDIVAVGVKPMLFVDYIALNPFRLDRESVLKYIASGFSKTLQILVGLSESSKSFTPIFVGGETADMPDQLMTIDVAGAVYGEGDCKYIIDGMKINSGDVILGLSSSGKAKYEHIENSGIMCNGLTLARHVLLNEYYASKYPETFDPNNRLRYSGPYKLDSYIDELGMTVMEALSSPTRIYAPIIAEVLSSYGGYVHGMVHITGGGFTKMLKVGYSVNYVINNLPEPPPIFKLIQRVCRSDWRDMYSVFNMGVGFVVIVEPSILDSIASICEKYGVQVFNMGVVKKNFDGFNRVIVKSENVKFELTPN
ncbi:MAG: AIR synthase-related protein [archaeon YNP-WB-040]|jgi:phosphoribosylformylglycinamidine cyclo-ligase|nr:AIR synthase-related protein [Candidatus Culexarchaeum yellowstonense]